MVSTELSSWFMKSTILQYFKSYQISQIFILLIVKYLTEFTISLHYMILSNSILSLEIVQTFEISFFRKQNP